MKPHLRLCQSSYGQAEGRVQINKTRRVKQKRTKRTCSPRERRRTTGTLCPPPSRSQGSIPRQNSQKPHKLPPRLDGRVNQDTQRKTRFQGHEEGLEGHTYTVGSQQSERFMLTTKALSNHVGRTLKNGGDNLKLTPSRFACILPDTPHMLLHDFLAVLSLLERLLLRP